MSVRVEEGPPLREAGGPSGGGAAASRVGPRPAPGWRERSMLALLALTVVLQLVAWSQLDGYQLADSVEYMERARSLARGESQDATRALRSFGFSILLAPFFLAADALGLADGRPVVGAVRLFQMLLGLGLVCACARIGARLGGRAAGLAAGFFVAVNPVFLQYSVSPVSGVAAALFVALALERLMEPGARRRALLGGLLLGAAFLMAYQTLLVAAPMLLVVLLRDRRSWRETPLFAALGFALGIAAQVVLDRLTWGVWGASVGNYVIQNASSVLVPPLVELGLIETATWVYERAAALTGAHATDPGAELRQLQSRTYYLSELGRMLVAPALLALGLGLARALRRPSWPVWLIVVVLLANAVGMSFKGSKSFRLWLPLLPMIAPLAGLGWSWLLGERPRRWALARASLAALVLGACAVLGLRVLRSVNLERFGVYWQAAELVNEATRDAASAGERPVLVSAYHWAVFGREAPWVELRKLPHHMDEWTKGSMDDGARAELLAALAEADWLLVHLPVLDQGRRLFDAVNARFELVDWLWSPQTEPTLGPVLVMRARREPREGERPRLLAQTLPPQDPQGYRRRLGLDRSLPAPMDFLLRLQDPQEPGQRVTLLGFEVERLPRSGGLWITYHWTTPTPLLGDYTVVDRLTAPDGHHAWQNNHQPARGHRPTSEWTPGSIVTEGHPLLPGSDPFTERFAPLGGPYRRADLAPVELWMTVVHQEPAGAFLGSLRPTLWGAERPLDLGRPELLHGDRRRSAEGVVESADRLARVARFLLPIDPRFAWPNDGSPDPP